MVSIIIPVFNNEKTIGKTLQSVAEQSYSDYEVIVINDGSTDASLEEIRRFTESDPRFSRGSKTHPRRSLLYLLCSGCFLLPGK